MMTRTNIGFIGAGSITEAIVEGMISEKFVDSNQIMLLNRSNSQRLEELKTTYSVHVTQDIQKLLQQNRVIILAMKPIDAPDALSKIQPYIHKNHLIISVLAGITTAYIEEKIHTRTPIVRAMPNTSATIGLSATAISGGAFANENDLLFTKRLFQTIGSVVPVPEDKMNAVTGLSGSGPAYFYYMVECMEKAAIQNGLDEETARELILQTIYGAAMMLRQTKQPAELLRKKITSPGGTTQAGIATLKEYDYEEALLACITDATNRSQQLGELFQKQN
ncbi:pyrroline-5-carboxylate reductase [Bacillus sp. N1-1]|jgi:pyrroline-5-carboxylate reductase|uniref:pyrroline-5-carboxylate reductase n=1 Tax=Bacillus sp. N1-1 TaxID=2682541 RepID=UPI001316400C|nr:pyrroline-5-carboxylate reductase [Bacillus sp. N1-1]QHA92464.1 pyrroline-5-carboxylate reductase [Bacillus sp. N1-1]